MKSQYSFTILCLSHRFIFVYCLIYWRYSHLDNRLNRIHWIPQNITSVINEQLNCMKSLTKSTGILPIKYFWNYFKHFLLIQCDLFSLVNERSELQLYLRDEKENIFFKVKILDSINISNQWQNNLFKLRNQSWQKLLIFTNLSYKTPAFIDDCKFWIFFFQLFLNFCWKNLQTFKKRCWIFLDNIWVVFNQFKIRIYQMKVNLLVVKNEMVVNKYDVENIFFSFVYLRKFWK